MGSSVEWAARFWSSLASPKGNRSKSGAQNYRATLLVQLRAPPTLWLAISISTSGSQALPWRGGAVNTFNLPADETLLQTL